MHLRLDRSCYIGRMGRPIKQLGFGKIELVITVVILGILFSLVLKGTAIIAPMRVFVAVHQINQYRAAVVAYQVDYHVLPGDDPTGPSRWRRPESIVLIGTARATTAGDDKISGLLDDSANPLGEQYLAWSDLRASGLVDGDPALIGQAARPENPFHGVYGFAEDNLGLDQVLCLTKVPGEDAALLDKRLDDGDVATGRVRGTSKWDPVGAHNHFAQPDTAPYSPDKTYIICLPYMP